MCSGSAPAAPESKDLIAIIHPAKHNLLSSQQSSTTPQRPSLAGRLRLSNAGSGFTTTHFQQSPSSLQAPFPSPVLRVRIQYVSLSSHLHSSPWHTVTNAYQPLRFAPPRTCFHLQFGQHRLLRREPSDTRLLHTNRDYSRR